MNSTPQFSLFHTSLGNCGIAWQNDVVVATSLPESSDALTVARLMVKVDAKAGEPPSHIQRAIALITALLEGEKVDLSGIECDFSGIDSLAKSIYDATRTIPPGETLSYGAVAAKIGNKKLAQHVGRVLGQNPLPIIVPCHRVIGVDGKLTGFSAHGGTKTKLNMLLIEGNQIGITQGLFDDL